MPTIAGGVVALALLAGLIVSLVLPLPFKSWASATFIAITSAILVYFFFSLVRIGRGNKRTTGDVLLVSALGVISLPIHFAFVYLHTGIYRSGDKAETIVSISDAIYFSVVTWTTLGYGDILPSPASKNVVMIEVALGYVLMALLIAALVRSVQREA